jgi:hypothetical protein
MQYSKLFSSMKSLLTAICLLSATILHAEVPSLINYQGLLTDINGNVVSGSKTVSISIHDAATDGAQLYAETIGSVAVQNGVYSFQFGAGPNFATALATGSQHWLQVTLDGVAQTPRERLVSVPFALKAAQADSLMPAPEADVYLRMMSVGQLTDGTNSRISLPVLLPVATRGTSERSIAQPIPTSVKRITELAARATTTITNASLTVRIIQRDNNGADTILATVQKPTGTPSTQTVSAATSITLDHVNYAYFVQATFVAGDSSLQMTTLHWIKLRAIQN